MKLRLEPFDEYMHPGPEPTFNESMYFNVYDPTAAVGGFVRLGNRPNEGHAEMTVCLYLPDGRAAFMFGRPSIDDNEHFDAGGARFDVQSPFEKLSVEYDGHGHRDGRSPRAVRPEDRLQHRTPGSTPAWT